MPTITDLFNVHLRQLALTLAESDVLLQKEGGLDGELKTSGSLCEQFIRQTLSKYAIPGQYRVTSGYIATPELLVQKRNLPQCDILIADNHMPPLLRLSNTGIEVIPLQAAVGLIEAKRTLTRKTLADALDHLNRIVESTGRSENLKMDRKLDGFNKYIGVHNHSSSKPLLGIIALSSGMADFAKEAVELILEKRSLIDFIWTLDGYSLVPGFKKDSANLLWYTHTARPENKTWSQLTEADFKAAPSDFYQSFSGVPVWCCIARDHQQSREAVFAKMIGLLSLTISRIFPENMLEEQISAYYLSAK